jgi:hypothetical protein
MSLSQSARAYARPQRQGALEIVLPFSLHYLTSCSDFGYTSPVTRESPAHPPSTMTRFRLWWDAADAALAARGEPPLDYEDARSLFDCELELDVPDALLLAPVAKGFEASR